MQNMISVIVPVYNAEQYLSRCIESILNQTLSKIELILVDDGSTDQSGRICDVYAKKDARIKVVHQENKGPIEARKRGLAESRCEYVTFVDSDDFILPVSYILSEPFIRNQIDMIMFGIIRYYDSDNQKVEMYEFNEGLYQQTEIEKTIWPKMIWNGEKERFGVDPSLCSKVIKKSLIISCYQDLNYSDFHYGEDVAIIYSAMKKANTIAIIHKFYYCHQMRTQEAVAGYYLDPLYFDKLYRLYQHMIAQFGNNEMFVRQIEQFYIYAVKLRNQAYGKSENKLRYLFPFDKVQKGDEIVLYGAGAVGRVYKEQLKKIDYCQIVLWVDKYFFKYNSDSICAVERIKTVSYDKVVIAIEDIQLCGVVKKALMELGVEHEKIVY